MGKLVKRLSDLNADFRGKHTHCLSWGGALPGLPTDSPAFQANNSMLPSHTLCVSVHTIICGRYFVPGCGGVQNLAYFNTGHWFLIGFSITEVCTFIGREGVNKMSCCAIFRYSIDYVSSKEITFPGHRHVVNFLSLFDYCNILVNEAHPLISEQLCVSIRRNFLEPAMKPDMLKEWVRTNPL